MYFITYICDPYYLIVHSCNVRVIKSDRAGVGKSLRVQRLTEALTTLNGALYTNTSACVTVSLQQKSADHSDVLRTLVKHIEQQPDRIIPRVFHFDIAREVTSTKIFQYDACKYACKIKLSVMATSVITYLAIIVTVVQTLTIIGTDSK